MTAILPEYVRWNNRITPSNEKVLFDPVNRRIEWDLGDIREHAGFIDPARVVAFQITLVPSASQIGNSPELLFNPTFSGLDTFSDTNITDIEENPNNDIGSEDFADDSKVVE